MVIFKLPENVFRSFVKKKIFNSIGLDPGVVRSRKSTTPNIVELHPGPSSNKELIKPSSSVVTITVQAPPNTINTFHGQQANSTVVDIEC